MGEEPCDSASLQSYLAHVSAASSALLLDQAGEAKRWIEQAPPGHRGWEWGFVRNRADQSEGSRSFGEAHPLSIEHHPDRPLLAVGMDDGSVRLVSASSLAETSEIRRHDGVVYRAVFSPDGARLASTARDFRLALTDVGTGDELWSVETPAAGISSVAFHPEGETLALVSWHRAEGGVRGLVVVYDAADGREIERMEFGDKPIVDVEFSPDGSLLAVGTWGWRVAVWPFPSLGEPMVYDLDDVPVYAAIDDVSFSSDGGSIVAASKDGEVRIWKTGSPGERSDIEAHAQPVAAVAFSPGGEILASGGWDGTIALWDPVAADRRLATLHGHDHRVRDLAWSPETETLYSISADGTLRSWNAASALPLTDRDGRGEHVYALDLSQDASTLVTGAGKGELAVWEAASGQLRSVVKVGEDLLNDAGLDPGSEQVVTCTWAGPPVVTDLRSGDVAVELSDGPGSADCGFSPDGERIYSSSSDGALYIWSSLTGELEKRLEKDGAAIARTAWLPSSDRFVTLTRRGALALRSLDRDEPLWSTDAHENGLALAVSRDGKLIASASTTGEIRIWRASDGALLSELAGHVSGVWSLSFHPSGERLASGSADQTVRIWDPRTGELMLIVPGWSQSVYNVAFSGDGARLFVNSSGAELSVLDGSH